MRTPFLLVGWSFSGGHRVCKSHKSLVDKLKLKFRLNDLRYTFGSRMAMAGVDLPTLKELMGHSSITLTMRYVHPTPKHKKEAMGKLIHFNSHRFSHRSKNRNP